MRPLGRAIQRRITRSLSSRDPPRSTRRFASCSRIGQTARRPSFRGYHLCFERPASTPLTHYSGRIAADFGGTETMTKPAHTIPPSDAAERRRAPPVLTYSVEQLPSFNAEFYSGARAELSKVAELMVPPRDAKAFEVPAGHFFRIGSVEGPQV